MKNDSQLILVNAKILPPVFYGVIKAKELLASGAVTSTSKAVELAGISRSTFYKYRDFVFKYTEPDIGTVSLAAVLRDRAGVFAAFTGALCKYGANIIKINQDLPENGVAAVTVTVTGDNIGISTEDFINELMTTEGVISVKTI